jgi:hypothetical protein
MNALFSSLNIRRVIIRGLLLIGLAQAFHNASGAEWQWSVPMGRGRAFLWIPPECRQVRAVVVAQNNMIEQGILEHPDFRRTLVSLDIAEVFIAPPFDFIFRFDKDAGERFNDTMQRLADVSGYSELNGAPVVPVGHSACASFPWNFAAWNPGRTLAVLSVHGDAPLTKFTGCGQPNPGWGDRTLDGVPGLMVMAEYEWGDSEHGVDRLSPALEYRRRHPGAPVAMLAEPGEGHFNYSDELVRYLAMFVRKAAEARLPGSPGGRPGDETRAGQQLKPVDPSKGWLVERWHLNQPRRFDPAPVANYKGDPAQAFWCFDREMALATHSYKAGQPGRLPQLLGISDGRPPLDNTCGEPVTLRFLPDGDGVTIRLKTGFMDTVPGDADHNQNAARWAYLPAGTKLGHATGGGDIRLQRIVGPAVQTGPDTFVLSLNPLNTADPGRSWDIWLWASHPGDAKFKSIVQQAVIHVPQCQDGAGQNITFPAIPGQKTGTKTLPLNARSDAGLKVGYYVLEGPAVVNGDLLTFTLIPPRAKMPVKVSVVAWQHGIPGKVKTAQPVTREFMIDADPR